MIAADRDAETAPSWARSGAAAGGRRRYASARRSGRSVSDMGGAVVAYRVKIAGRVIGPEFDTEAEAHHWVWTTRPGEAYGIVELRQT